jgi:ribosomal protein S18 acetylase RimI-like enzyme
MNVAPAISEFLPAHVGAARMLWKSSEGVGLSSADEPSAVLRFLERNPGLSFVAHSGNDLIGTILCGHDGRRGLIHHLVVAEHRRREGYGRALLARGLNGLCAAGIEKAHLLVFRSNPRALAFWNAVGAQERTAMALFSMETAGQPRR